MDASLLHVFTARFNPVRWEAPERLYRQFVQHMLDSGVRLHVIELQYGERPFTAQAEHVDHIGVRAKTAAWCKECLLNVGIRRTPDARYIAWIDADILFRRADWAVETVHALQIHDIVQPWSHALDMGPNSVPIQQHVSFAHQMVHGEPLVANGPKHWTYNGGPYAYPHSGYAWAVTRQAYDWVGGLFDVGGMGSADHHMSLALAGQAERSLPGGVSASYRRQVMQWQQRAVQHINRNVGYVHGLIEHGHHGCKEDRAYLGRWEMFVRHGFDPDTDLKVNSSGVIEWTGNKPELAREFLLYLKARREDMAGY